MGSPSFAKPEFVSAIAVMHDADYSEETILSFRQMNEYDEDDFSDESIIEIINDIESDWVSEVAGDVERNIERIKELVDSKLETLKPQVEFSYQSSVSEWFDVERVYAYNGDGIGFEILPSLGTPEPSTNYTYADAFWDYVLNKEELEAQGVTFNHVKEFFDTLESAYDYMMLAVGYEFHASAINGGWSFNTSEIEHKPEPDECLVGTGIAELINAELSRFNAQYEGVQNITAIPLCNPL